MLELRFEWDSAKAEENLWKHGVSFEEAQTVFNDDLPGSFMMINIQNGRIDYLNEARFYRR